MIEVATFGAGCFWGVQNTFDKLNGVIETVVGYAGGETNNPSYQAVCSHTTGHAEVIQIKFDNRKIDYETLLQVFWRIHNPTTLNRQGPDIGTQYRSVIFYHSREQQQIAIASKEKQQQQYSAEIVTEIVPAADFYPAEEYHQHYHQKHS